MTAYRMEWPILDPRIPLADIIGGAWFEVSEELRTLGKMGQAGDPEWVIRRSKRGLTLTCTVPLDSPPRVNAAEHGTRSGFQKHKREGSVACVDCTLAEREYQRGRKRAARSQDRRTA